MTTFSAALASNRTNSQTVRTCYDLMNVAPACAVTDFTEGKYLDDRNDCAAYQAAQQRQADYLLDQARCGPGTRLLDIGCGYGRILEQAQHRGAQAVGITLAPPQVAYCRARGLNVHELNYRDTCTQNAPWTEPATSTLPPTTNRGEINRPTFHAIIANGSLEHFVQVADAVAGRADAIYEDFFAICRRLLLGDGRLVTTAIHFREAGQFAAAAIARGPHAQQPGSANFKYAMLVRVFGGWYPEPGQLVRCAANQFELIDEEDGTHDYLLTSEYWLRRLKLGLATNPRVWWAVARQIWKRPQASWDMLCLQLRDEAWVWQFREPAPMQLLRQTWRAK